MSDVQPEATPADAPAPSLDNDEVQERGFVGHNPDPHDNEHYTMAGAIRQLSEPKERKDPARLKEEHSGIEQDEHPAGAGPTGK